MLVNQVVAPNGDSKKKRMRRAKTMDKIARN